MSLGRHWVKTRKRLIRTSRIQRTSLRSYPKPKPKRQYLFKGTPMQPVLSARKFCLLCSPIRRRLMQQPRRVPRNSNCETLHNALQMSFMLRVPAWDTMWVSWVSTVKLCATLQPSLTMFPVASMYHLMLMPPKCRPLTSGLRIIPRVRAYLHQSMCRLLRLWETSIPLRYLLGWTTSA